MRLRPNSSKPVPQNNSGPLLHPGKEKFASKVKKSLIRERLSDADLEQLRLDILRSEKIRHYWALIIAALFLTALGVSIFLLF